MVEVEGIQVNLVTNYDKEGKASTLRQRNKESKSKHPKNPTTDRSRSTQSLVHDPGGPRASLSTNIEDGESSDEEDPELPLTVDLAQSYLQEEAQGEKEKLKAAIVQSRHIDQSSTSSEVDDDPNTYGVGNALSLPGFLADFLKGVGDRVQVKVKRVVINLDFKIDISSEKPRIAAGEGADTVTIRFSIEDIDLLGVAPHDQNLDRTDDSRDVGIELPDKQPLPAGHETRQVALSNIEILLVSDAAIFVNLSRFDEPPSPTATQTSSAGRSGTKARAAASSSSQSDSRPSFDPGKYSGIIEKGRSIITSPGSASSSIISDGRRFADPEGDEEVPPKSASVQATSLAYNSSEEHFLDHSVNIEGGDLDNDEEAFSVEINSVDVSGNNESPSEKQSTSSYHQIFRGEDHLDLSRSTEREDSRTESSLNPYPPQSSTFNLGKPNSQGRGHVFEHDLVIEPAKPFLFDFERGKSHSKDAHSGSTSPISEDLTQSKIFSHEEAESMYMSAISHNPLDEMEAESMVPGRWDDSVSDANNLGPSLHLSEERAIASSTGSPLLDASTTNQGPISRGSHPSIQHGEQSPALTQNLRSNDQQISDESQGSEGGADRLSLDVKNTASENSQNSSTRLQNPLLIMKKIMSIDKIHLDFPIGSSMPAKTDLLGLAQDISDKDTHSFSTPKDSIKLGPEEKGSDGRHSARTGGPGAEGISSKIPHSNRSTDPSSQHLSIEVGLVEVLGDIGLTKLTILIIQQNLAFLGRGSADNEDGDSPNQSAFIMKLKMTDLSWKFLESVRGYSSMDESSEYSSSGPKSFAAVPEVLLRASLSDLKFSYKKHGFSMNSGFSIGKMSFGYASENILSFDSELKMRESTGDTLAPVGNDVALTVIQSSTATKINLTTLPLRFVLDLRRLDETIGWFGGFSSILGLGSSMMSTVTVVSAKPLPSHGILRPRAVHFEQSVPDRPAYERPTNARKFDARLGGLALVLQGANCMFRLDGTALKAVSRPEGIGVRVDKLRFTGPYIEHDNDACAVKIHLASMRVEYISTPKELDLTRLLSLLSPSRDQYEQDDDILLDTLLHQRRQAGVIRVTLESLQGDITKPSHLRFFVEIVEELKKLSTVAKYLPEDDRPGILTFCLIRELQCVVRVNDSFGSLALSSRSVELAHITLPGLIALGIKTLQLQRNDDEELIGDASQAHLDDDTTSPMIMARFIGNEMEPNIKVKIHNLRLEYHVPTLMAAMNLSGDDSPEFHVSDMISSIATLKVRHQPSDSSPPSLSQASSKSDKYATSTRPMRLIVAIRDSIVGLNPMNCPSKGLVVLTNAQLNGIAPKVDEVQATLDIKRASILIIDDKSSIKAQKDMHRPGGQDSQDNQIQHFLDSGFVSVSYISSAKASMTLAKSELSDSQILDVEIRDDLFVLESCADSTQTLLAILNGLNPPAPQSPELKYRTEIVPVEDMLASLSGDAFAASGSGEENVLDLPLGLDEGDLMDDEVPQNLEYVSSFYNPEPARLHESIAEVMLDNDLESLAGPPVTREIGDKRLLESFQEQYQIAPGNAPLEFQENHFGTSSTVGGTAHRWDTKQNTYGLSNDVPIRDSPLRLRVRDVHIIWNLFDGYDWPHTREVITKAVTDIENKAAERYSIKDKRKSVDVDDEDSEIGDFLFNSIYVGIPANRDPKDLARQVNRNIDDLASETESYAPSSISGSPNRQSHMPRGKIKKLRLTRSKYHKMTFELTGVSADLVIFPPSEEETQSSIDIRVQDLDIFDHVPTSTWKKFATYMHDAGERESGTSMIHLEIRNVKPVPTLAASEIILKVCFFLEVEFLMLSGNQVTVLPLRLHVDQDALDFMTRFFDFKDDSSKSQTNKSDAPFLQRVEVNPVRLKLDFKPKRVDYAGLRSGRTNEFMNFFILDRADMVLRHVIIYGVSGFDRLNKTLNDIWMPDIKHNQLPGVLAGLAPVRSLVNVGAGVRDLVVVPIREYKKDGRIMRSLQKGALAFAKTTSSELVKLGAKLAIGTQTVLQGADDFLSQPGQTRTDVSAGWEDAQLEEDEKKHISLYADQPVGVMQGLRGAYAGLERDLLTARDAIVAMPGEVIESATAGEAARVLLRTTPTLILRPAVGVTKAIGQTLMGATNSLDPDNRRRIEEVCFRHLYRLSVMFGDSYMY